MTAEQVADIATRLNSNDIENTYGEQKEKFAEALVKQNPDNFSGHGKKAVLNNLPLEHVPIYKGNR